MAVITLGCGRHMPGILTGCGNAIMTIRTVASRIRVIELHCQPVGLRGMAGITFRVCLHMVGRLAGRYGAIMTAGTDTDRYRMVEVNGGPVVL